MSLRTLSLAAVAAAAAALAGCAEGQFNLGGLGGSAPLETATVAPSAPRVDSACAGLAAQLDGLRRDTAAIKVEQASQKKAKVALTAAETAKVDQLNKANTDFQARCSNYKPANIATPAPSAPAVAPSAAGLAAARPVAQKVQ